MVTIPSFSKQSKDHLAILMYPSLKTRTYEELESNSIKYANYLNSLDLQSGSHIAIYADNCIEFLEMCWAAQRSGIIYTCIPYHLSKDEAEYIIFNCGARLVAYSDKTAKIINKLKDKDKYSSINFLQLENSINSIKSKVSSEVCFEEIEGSDMLYSSGTTGKPKGIKLNFAKHKFGTSPYLVELIKKEYDFSSQTIYLSPAPLYHAAPLRFCMAVHRLGGTVICMEKFYAEESLKVIDTYKVTHSQWVPTMLHRIISLPENTKSKYNCNSLKAIIHAAAPCPVELKIKLIKWFGNIIYEYYASTEGAGFCAINSEQWLKKIGSVGKAIKGKIKICSIDNPDKEIDIGKVGLIFFSEGENFEYHNDLDKTKKSKNNKDWVTVGDIGYLDEDGYLYLTDRSNNVIISGGVNIYPQEIENLLSSHDYVFDVAVVAKKDIEFGELPHAIVVKKTNISEKKIIEDLIEYCKKNISSVKCPKSWEFRESLPREDNGKLYKNKL